MTAWEVSGRVKDNSALDLDRTSPAQMWGFYLLSLHLNWCSPKGQYSVIQQLLSAGSMLGTMLGAGNEFLDFRELRVKLGRRLLNI